MQLLEALYYKQGQLYEGAGLIGIDKLFSSDSGYAIFQD
jgi:hypothetical protein